jgi:DNA segregation ATPase FtsK/SpoIIIE, S-DNA-T family
MESISIKSNTHMTNTLTDEQLSTIATLQLKLNALGVEGHFLPDAREGPVITLYKFVPKGSTRVAQIENLSQDLAIALSAEAVQVKRLAKESAVGIYVPNKVRKNLDFLNAVSSVYTSDAKIPLLLGMDVDGKIQVVDLVTLPHLLIAGSTGSGKSTLLNCILASLAYCRTPQQIQLVLSDTKQVEFTHFVGAPHLLFPPASSVYQSLEQLEWVTEEVDARLKRIAKSASQNIAQFNAKNPDAALPYIVVVIDELAELLTSTTKNEDEKIKLGKLAEQKLGLIAQKARASGVHLIASTQQPTVKIVTGSIKANFPARISFRLPAESDSRTILAKGGAEQLLAQGDMLFLSPNSPEIQRIHTPFTRIEDVQQAIEVACRRN